MDKAALHKALALASDHVCTGDRLIVKQTQMVETLHNGGHDTTIARALLQIFQETQDIFESDLARLSGLAAKSGSEG